VEFLTHYFAARMAQELKLPFPPTFSEKALQALENHPWPGNVRELKNLVERLVYRSASHYQDPIEPWALEPFLAASLDTPSAQAPTPNALNGHASSQTAQTNAQNGQASAQTWPPPRLQNGDFSPSQVSLPLKLGQFDELLRQQALGLINQAMAQANQNQIQAAKLLGLTYHRFRALRRKFSAPKFGLE
jgi:psp operon transcriptional activator